MELTIKPAREYAEQTQTKEQVAESELRDRAISFINNVVQPQIEDCIAHPEKYTAVNGRFSFKAPFYPVEPFVQEVSKLLKPLGFNVGQSHDGGGMYATIIIEWILPPAKKLSEHANIDHSRKHRF